MKKIILSILLIYSTVSFACECGINSYPYTNGKTQSELFLEDSFKNATIIFFGEYDNSGEFRIIKFYRGKELITNPGLIEQTEDKSLCDDTFKKNKRYLIFGKVDDLGKLRTSICYANVEIKNKEQLKFVKKYLKS